MSARMTRSAPQSPFELPEVTAVVCATHLSCQNAGKAQKFTPVRGSSGESQLKEELMGSNETSRRDLLKSGAALAGGVTLGELASSQAQAHDHPMTPGSQNASPMILGSKELVEYGQRSRYVTSVRIQHPPGGRPSPDLFGKVFHVASPLQDSVGVITPSSLHYVATTRGSYMPDIDPKLHTLTIHGLVDQPLTLTMDDLKRFPSVTRLHFIECAGNRHTPQQKTVQETHGMTSCAEWTGVPL